MDTQMTENFEQTKIQTADATPQAVEQMFADGIAALWLRNGILKLDLYQSGGMTSDNKGEYRRLTQRVSMPLSALAELKGMIEKLEAALSENKPN